ncbi:DsbA family protein [Patescibacteria group bacterium]|nr:DsbA family protein [Patescibacteria group bacterium]MBU1908282.1 DsbA family protein [Patescibacteria group bacterium]
MPTHRTKLLILFTALFLILCAFFVYQAVQFNSTHYQIGYVPVDIANQPVPKDIPLGAIRPPAIRQYDPARFGGATAMLSVIEFGDFNCEECRQAAKIIDEAVRPYGGTVRFVWRDLPLDENDTTAMDASLFSRCAGLQNKYWETFDALIAQTSIKEKTFGDIAAQLNLDKNFMKACRADQNLAALLIQDVGNAKADGINSTPFIFIGTRGFNGVVDIETLKQAIEQQLQSI